MRRFVLSCLAFSLAAALQPAAAFNSNDENAWQPLRDGAQKAVEAAAKLDEAQPPAVPHGLDRKSVV